MNEILFIDERVSEIFQTKRTFDDLMSIKGECYRSGPGRKTIHFTVGEKGFFIKKYTGIGWKEVFKELLQGRKPVLGAMDEWRAIQRLNDLSVATLNIAAYGKRGIVPASMHSFLVTDELEGFISLEDLCATWLENPPGPVLKRRLIYEVAEVARRLHNNGVNHRDFYLCHLLISSNYEKLPDSRIHIIDLHRAQIRKHTPTRWTVKDIAALMFSSRKIGLSRRDIFRFMIEYSEKSLKKTLDEDSAFWDAVDKKTQSLVGMWRRLERKEHLDTIL